MKITKVMLMSKLYEILQKNAPVRRGGGAVGNCIGIRANV